MPHCRNGKGLLRDNLVLLLKFSSARTTYNGHAVRPIMGKSLNAIFNGTADRIYGDKDIVADEMFNNSAVYTGDWIAIRHEPPVGDGKWQLISISDDPTETTYAADQHPDMMKKLISAYDTYAKDVGIVIPQGETYDVALASAIPPVNESQVTISSADIIPENFTQN